MNATDAMTRMLLVGQYGVHYGVVIRIVHINSAQMLCRRCNPLNIHLWKVIGRWAMTHAAQLKGFSWLPLGAMHCDTINQGDIVVPYQGPICNGNTCDSLAICAKNMHSDAVWGGNGSIVGELWDADQTAPTFSFGATNNSF